MPGLWFEGKKCHAKAQLQSSGGREGGAQLSMSNLPERVRQPRFISILLKDLSSFHHKGFVFLYLTGFYDERNRKSHFSRVRNVTRL